MDIDKIDVLMILGCWLQVDIYSLHIHCWSYYTFSGIYVFSWHYLHVKSSFHIHSLMQKAVIPARCLWISWIGMLLVLLCPVRHDGHSLITQNGGVCERTVFRRYINIVFWYLWPSSLMQPYPMRVKKEKSWKAFQQFYHVCFYWSREFIVIKASMNLKAV